MNDKVRKLLDMVPDAYCFPAYKHPVAHLTCSMMLPSKIVVYNTYRAAIFHHSLTLHSSGENKSGQPRRAFVINAFADGVVSDSDEPLLEGVPVIRKGRKMEGQFFPLLYQ